MFNWFRQQVLLAMRVPHDPEPPFGAPGSIRIFRAGRNYFNLRLLGWGFTQLVVLAGIIFWAVVLIDVEQIAHEQKQTRGVLPKLTPETWAKGVTEATTDKAPDASPNTPQTQAPVKKQKKTQNFRLNGWNGFKQGLVEIALRLPDWAFPLIWVLKLIGFALYLAQIPFTYALRRLDYELRWYIVTDRSLRIRTGLVRLQESTMSFANIQQVEVKQDPIQRLLKLADVHVQSAGGGGDREHGKGEMHDSLHTGIFRSVDNATEIRDLILERLRQFRQAGLGDPDDHHEHQAVGGVPPPRETLATNSDTLAAARDVLAEAQALRATLTS
jgi:membrane protein YdbS with pleckstrin-like domain